jgi:hypothetical protein
MVISEIQIISFVMNVLLNVKLAKTYKMNAILAQVTGYWIVALTHVNVPRALSQTLLMQIVLNAATSK